MSDRYELNPGRCPATWRWGAFQVEMDKLKSVDHFLCNSKCATGSEQTKAALQGGVHPKVEMAKTSACKSLCVQRNVSQHMLDTQKGKA